MPAENYCQDGSGGNIKAIGAACSDSLDLTSCADGDGRRGQDDRQVLWWPSSGCCVVVEDSFQSLCYCFPSLLRKPKMSNDAFPLNIDLFT